MQRNETADDTVAMSARSDQQRAAKALECVETRETKKRRETKVHNSDLTTRVAMAEHVEMDESLLLNVAT